jgi:uncharacterized membrane protein YoaK (UPF0700 family)
MLAEFLIGAFIVGASLGHFFTFLVLAPATVVVTILIIAVSTAMDQTLEHTLVAIVLTLPTLQISYVIALVAR